MSLKMRNLKYISQTSYVVILGLWLYSFTLNNYIYGQEIAQKQDDPIKLGTTLVQVPVVISDPGGRYITDLSKKDFSIFEDGIRQEISFFGSIEEPFNAVLLLDSSGSTQAQIAMIKQAAYAFIESLRPQDHVMIIVFNDTVEVLCDLTNDRGILRNAIENVRTGEFTQVYEAVYTAVWEKLGDIPGRKALILFTDGIDTASSEISEEDTLDAVIESEDIIIYPIRFSTRADVERKLESRRNSIQKERIGVLDTKLSGYLLELDRAYRQADEYLYELAKLSGGVVERVDKITDLRLAFNKIADQLRHQYVLGYYPINRDRENRIRKIDIKVNRSGVKIRFRPGYKNFDQ